MTPRRKLAIMALLLLSIPVFAAAPKRLSVLLGGVPLEGKALWYDNQVYVPLESVSKALDGQYHYDAKDGVASVRLGAAAATSPRVDARTASLPHLKTLQTRTFSTGDNMKVIATITNSGNAAARDVEVVCTFESGYLGEINMSIANIPELAPGQRKTVEFWLYEQRIPDHTGGRPYAQPMAVPGGYLARGNNYVYLAGSWARVTHNLQFRFLSPDGTYRGT